MTLITLSNVPAILYEGVSTSVPEPAFIKELKLYDSVLLHLSSNAVCKPLTSDIA
jgi:hypothetical protein